MYNLSVQTFHTMSLITQDVWIVQIIAFWELVKHVKIKIDFLICSLKFNSVLGVGQACKDKD